MAKFSSALSPAFTVKGLDAASKKLTKNAENTINKLATRMGKAVDVVYKTVTTKRPIARISSLGGGGMRFVSDPHAKFGVPVRTGALKASIQKEVKFISIRKVMGRVWTESPYALKVEFGEGRRLPRPFMRPALDLNKKEITNILSGEYD